MIKYAWGLIRGERPGKALEKDGAWHLWPGEDIVAVSFQLLRPSIWEFEEK